MNKDKILNWLPWIIFIGILFAIWLSMTACYNPQIDTDITRMGVTYEDGYVGGEPAKDKPMFVTRSHYRTDEAFKKGLCDAIEWLESKGWEVTKIRPVYGTDMTMKESIKYYCIYYKEKK